MTSPWLVVIAVVAIALSSALVLGRRRLGGKVSGSPQRAPVTSGPAMKRPPTERPSSPPRTPRPAPPVTELVLVGRRVRVTVNGSGLVIQAQRGSSWAEPISFDWSRIHRAYFSSGTFDAPLALYATMSNGEGKSTSKQHLVDSQQLNRGQWSEFASAVAERTSGRLVIDLSPLDDA
jgi:hypothetical protein